MQTDSVPLPLRVPEASRLPRVMRPFCSFTQHRILSFVTRVNHLENWKQKCYWNGSFSHLMIHVWTLFTAPERSLQSLCFYTCLSVILFTGGGVPGQVPLQAGTPSRIGIPLGRYPLAPGQVPPGRYPPGRYTPWVDTPPGHSACWDTVNKRAVRIPLECILVLGMIFSRSSKVSEDVTKTMLVDFVITTYTGSRLQWVQLHEFSPYELFFCFQKRILPLDINRVFRLEPYSVRSGNIV